MAGTRASLSISKPNEEWIQTQIQSGEFASRSEVVNDLIRRAREVEVIRQRLIAAEQAEFSTRTVEETLSAFRERARADGKL